MLKLKAIAHVEVFQYIAVILVLNISQSETQCEYNRVALSMFSNSYVSVTLLLCYWNGFYAVYHFIYLKHKVVNPVLEPYLLVSLRIWLTPRLQIH